MTNIYLYGMILISNSFLLTGDYPEADTYGEINEKYILPGGETGTCATVLSSLGCSVKMDGTHMGNNTFYKIQDFYKNTGVDISSLAFDNNYDGLQDYIIIDKTTRTPFGMFNKYFSDSKKRWNIPKKSDIINSMVVGLDPFFNEQSTMVAEICKENNKPYVVIDCPYDSEMNKYASISLISNEYIRNNYKDIDKTELFNKYTENSSGLIIFTFGSKSIMYGRKNEEIKFLEPFKIKPVSTLGAGDCFKAGCVYALFKKMDDDDCVKFASATAATACMNFPIPLNPPTLEKINNLLSQY